MMNSKKILIMAVSVLLILIFVPSALAVHDNGLFELDVVNGMGEANTVNDPSVAGDDWDDVYNGTSSAFATAFIEDSFANGEVVGFESRTPEISFFTGGGSKDTEFLQDPGPGGASGGPWLYDTFNDQVPDKNDIVNAFAAAYDELGTGNTIFYFGLDTYAVQGANNVGFWFFRQPVGLNPIDPGPDGIIGTSDDVTPGTFSGDHSDGDIFVAAEFTQGGSVGTVQVYRWDSTIGPGNKPLGPQLVLSAADCATAPPNDDVCGVINMTPGEDPPWDYIDKDGDSTYKSSAFVEFGLDVTALLGQDIGCFSSFLAETRSSQSLTAQLKDFALGAFPVCGIEVIKDGDTLSKVTDPVDYTITIENTGRATLYKQSIVDTVFGDLTDGTNSLITASNCGANLAPGATCTISLTRIVQAGDPDPLPNTVTVTYTEFADPASLAFTDSDDHSVNLFQPAIALSKTGDALSKVGDDVSYTITLSNNSSADTPDLVCTISDPIIGFSKDVTLASGGSDVSTVSWTIPEGASDPYDNTASVTCSPLGFPNVLEASASHSTNLFQPAIDVRKTGDELSKVGDPVDYTITLSNNSSTDTPALECTATDSLLGQVFNGVLPAGDTVINLSRDVQAGDPDPLVNTVTLTCSPLGFPNVLTASASHSTNLFQPAIALEKTGDELSKVGDPVDYTITLSNNSSTDTPALECTATDSLLGQVFNGVLPTGDTVINLSRDVQAGDPDPLVNTVTLTCSPLGFPNVLTASASHSTNLFQPAIDVTKTGDELSKVGDPVNYTITLSNNSSTDTPALECTATDSLLGQVFNGVLPAGDTVINLSRDVQAGDPDPLVNTVTLTCSPLGFSNVLEASDSHSTNLFQPAIALEKTGDALSKIGDPVNYAITLTNNSSPDSPALACTITDATVGVNEQVTLASGANHVVNVNGFVIPAGASDPYDNTASVTCSPDGFPNVLTASASHSTNLFQPGIDVTKTGDELSKVGDPVNYTITLNNTSSADSPNLVNGSIVDSLLGNLLDPANPFVTNSTCTATLPTGGSCTIQASRTVAAGDADPLPNTVTVHYNPEGFPNDITDSDSHSVELFQPAIDVRKTGDELSKVGDPVDYTITLSNNSSTDTPALECTATDSLLGQVFNGVLPAGDTVINLSRDVQAGDPDPLVNTVTLTCSPLGFSNVLEASDSHSTNLFQPAITLDKTGDEYSKNWGGQADEITYNVTIENTSSNDTPNLSLVSFNDTLVPGATPSAECDDLLPGESCSFSYTYTPTEAEGQDDILSNTATAVYSPDGFPNQIPGSDSHDVTLIHPSFTVAKSCTNEPVPLDGPATWDVLISNTGDVELIITADDGIGEFTLAAGASQTFQVSQSGDFRGQANVSNTVNASWRLPASFGLSNTDSASDSDDCVVAGEAKITKLTQGLPNEAPNPATQDWRFTLQDCGVDGCQKDDPVIGDITSPPSMVTFDADLVPVQWESNQTYRLCEVLIPAAWTNTWMGDADDDGTPETAIPFVAAVSDDPVTIPPGWSRVYDPQFAPPPAIWSNDERCLNFAVDAGATEVFEINNEFPGGEPRTIGYWKNWNSCTGGNQVQTAIKNGGPTPPERLGSGNALLDDVLQPPGITIGDLTMSADADVFNCDQGTQDAVNILDKRAIDGNNKKKANDAAYGLAAQLLAAIANDTAGAGVCSAAGQAIIDAQILLEDIDFDGTGDYYKGNVNEINGHTKEEANTLAGILDSYNNGTLCSP